MGADGTVHFVDLAGGIPYLRSTDRGDHWSEPQTLSTDNQTVDRQWVDAWGPDFVVASWAVSGRQAREISFVASHDGGASWSEPRTLTKKMLQLGPIVIAADGQHVYQPYVTPSPFVLHVLVSADRGGNWTDVNTKRTMTIPDDAPMVNNDWSPTFVFPAIAADHHNVYVVWSEYRADKTTHLVLLRSSDAGKSWMEPLLLDESRPNSVLPWIAVGDDGHVAITSLQSDTAMDPNKGLHHWMLHALVTPNAMDASPSWSDGLVTPDIVQTGAICPEGGGCLTRVLPVYGDRTLLDFMEDAIGPDGSLSVTWTQPNQTHDPEIRFAHQTSGSPLRAPLAPRASS